MNTSHREFIEHILEPVAKSLYCSSIGLPEHYTEFNGTENKNQTKKTVFLMFWLFPPLNSM